jgi:hypothetical protein
MNDLNARIRASLWWLLPLVALVILIGWEINWGRAVHLAPPVAEPITPKAVVAGLLPVYTIAGGLGSHAETVNRTLFNPTRRPAPVAVAEVAKPRIQRGQFALTGTTVAGDRSLAFLKEQSGGKARTVRQGETINGMLVAEVKPDRVKFTLGDESEEVFLKVATNSKPTPQPAAPAAAAPPGPPGQPAPPPVAAAVQAQPDNAQTLAERRRAARAAEAAAAVAAPAPVAPAPAANAAAEQVDPRWAIMDQKYQQRAAPAGAAPSAATKGK